MFVAPRRLWQKEDAAPRGIQTEPPFTFSGLRKAQLLACLNRFRGAARKLTPTSDSQLDKLAECIECGPPSLTSATHQVVLSHVHGDLNGNNVLLWLKHRQPFFIDFATYHEGLMVQDIARLETETRFALMDKEADSQAPAWDYDLGRLPRWIEIEEQHPVTSQPTCELPRDGIGRAWRLVRYLRDSARTLYAQGDGSGCCDFNTEYQTALLHQALRAIGYDALPCAKRIYAIYCASRLLSAL